MSNTFTLKHLLMVAIGSLSITVATDSAAWSATITHQPSDRVPPVAVSPAFGLLAAGGTVGTAYTDFGVDYSFGNKEGIFDDGILAFGGVSSTNNVDLRTSVDGRVVLPGTITQGLTSLISVEAGFSNPGDLLLEVFGVGGNLLSSILNSSTVGSTGRSLITINRGVADIAFFRISTPTQDGFGVDLVSLEQPIGTSTPVPTPALLPGLIGLGFGVLRKRKAEAAKATSDV